MTSLPVFRQTFGYSTLVTNTSLVFNTGHRVFPPGVILQGHKSGKSRQKVLSTKRLGKQTSDVIDIQMTSKLV